MRRKVPEKFWSKLAKTVEREKPRFVVLSLATADGLAKRAKGDLLLVDATDSARESGDVSVQLAALPPNLDKAFIRRIQAIQGRRAGKR
jgi:hypothetical protein